MKKESDPNRAFYNTNLSMITTFHRLTNSRSRFLTVYGYIYCLYKLVPDITSVITAINAHLKLIYRIKLVSAVLKTKKKKTITKEKTQLIMLPRKSNILCFKDFPVVENILTLETPSVKVTQPSPHRMLFQITTCYLPVYY